MRNKNNDAKLWYATKLQYDQRYFLEVFNSYTDIMVKIYDSISAGNVYQRSALSVPNEVVDYLEGNGFEIQFSGADILIQAVPES